MKTILVVAVHPDDETLGCGGTLLKHKDNGDEIHWIIATDVKNIPKINICQGLFSASAGFTNKSKTKLVVILRRLFYKFFGKVYKLSENTFHHENKI